MCPLRIILVFLSATLAGFFVLRNLKAQPESDDIAADSNSASEASPPDSEASPRSRKVMSAIGSGFWMIVDMASGRYLWRNLIDAKRSN